MHLVIYEGSFWSDFAPLTLTRPAFLLRSGASTLLEKQLRAIRPTRLTLWVRDELAELARQRVEVPSGITVSVNTPLDDEPALLVAGRTIHMSRFEVPPSPCVVVIDDPDHGSGWIKMAYTRSPGLSHADVFAASARWKALRDLPHTMPQARFPRHWADLVAWNEESIVTDSIHWTDAPPTGATMVRPENVHAREGVVISQGVVLDASRGPILLDRHCHIGANSIVEGPCYIGVHTRITPLSLIRPGTSIGPVCRVGGEVSNTIIMGYTNKSHDGFLGDSYIGEWVNMGAGTTTGNLKSTYGEIKLARGRSLVDTGRQLLGVGIGDHAKLATNTLLPVGGYVGVASMLGASRRVDKSVPSFRFITDDADEPFNPDKACEVAARMQSRRQQNFSQLDKQLLVYAQRAAADIE